MTSIIAVPLKGLQMIVLNICLPTGTQRSYSVKCLHDYAFHGSKGKITLKFYY